MAAANVSMPCRLCMQISLYTQEISLPEAGHKEVDLLFSLLQRKSGFAVMGNWEHWSKAKPERWRPILRAHHVRPWWKNKSALRTLVYLEPTIILPVQAILLTDFSEQTPYCTISFTSVFSSIMHYPIRLVLSGHAHGGQMRLPFEGIGVLKE